MYVQSAYGQKVFNFTIAEEISNTKLEFCMNRPIFLLMLLDTRLMYQFYSFENKKLTASLTGHTLCLAMHAQRQSIGRY